MKKKRLLVVVCIILCISVLSFFAIRSFNKKSYAVGNIYVSPSSLTIEEGSTQSFTIKSENAIGDVSIESSNNGVASVSQNEWSTGMVGENETKSGTITVTGVSVGNATITMTIDGATFDEEDLSGQVRTVTVNVVPKQVNNNDNGGNTSNNNTANNNDSNNNVATNNNSGNSSTNITSNNNTGNNSQSNDSSKKSDNNNIKELSVEGYKVKKISNNNYSLDVNRDLEKINIKVVCEDDKATVTGTGEKSLKDGENKFEIVVTSESGKTNKIYLTVKKISIYELKDLDTALTDKSDDSIIVKMDSNSSVTSKDLLKIKESGKTINLVDDSNTKYSFIIDGKMLSNIEDSFSTKISFTSEFEDKINKLSNNVEGEFLHFGQKNQFPDGIMLKLYVTDMFADDDTINVYYYDNKNDKLVEKDKNLAIKDGYVQFKLNSLNDHFVTNATIENKNGSLPIVLLIGIILLIGVIVFLILKGKKKANNDSPNGDSIDSISNYQDVNTGINNNAMINDANVDTSNNIDTISNEVSYTDNNMGENSVISGIENVDNSLSSNNIDSGVNELSEIDTNADDSSLSDVSDNNSLGEIDSNTLDDDNENNTIINSFDSSNDGILEDIKSVSVDENIKKEDDNSQSLVDDKKSEPVITAVTEEYDTTPIESDTPQDDTVSVESDTPQDDTVSVENDTPQDDTVSVENDTQKEDTDEEIL